MFVKCVRFAVIGSALAVVAGCVPVTQTRTVTAVPVQAAQPVQSVAPVTTPRTVSAPVAPVQSAPAQNAPAEVIPAAAPANPLATAQEILIQERNEEDDGDEDGGWGG